MFRSLQWDSSSQMKTHTHHEQMSPLAGFVFSNHRDDSTLVSAGHPTIDQKSSARCSGNEVHAIQFTHVCLAVTQSGMK